MRFTCVPGGVDIKKHRKALQNADFWTRAAREWYKLYTPYVPMDTGRLLRDVRFGPGTIEHRAPYARRVYHGAGLDFRRDRHPLAAANWDRAAEKARRDELLRRLQALVDAGHLRPGR